MYKIRLIFRVLLLVESIQTYENFIFSIYYTFSTIKVGQQL